MAYLFTQPEPLQSGCDSNKHKSDFMVINTVIQPTQQLICLLLRTLFFERDRIDWRIVLQEKDEVLVDGRKGMQWESLEWLGGETEKYWSSQKQ